MRLSWIGVRSAALAALAASSAAADSSRGWSVTPPAGWADRTAEAKQSQELRAQEAQLASLNLDSDLVAYGNATNEELLVLYVASRRASGDPAAELRGWEDGARRAIGQIAKERSFDRRATGKVVLIDTVLAVGNEKVYARYLAGFDPSLHLRALTARCRGAEAVCLAANRSATLDETALRVLPADARPPASASNDRSESAYNQGRMVGMILVFAAVAAWALGKYLRRKR